MTNKETQGQWTTWFADVTEDVAQAVLLFIPNGLSALYSKILKRLPFLGAMFSKRGFETTFKFCTGITILQELGRDVAYFLFRPLGFVLGSFVSLSKQNRPAPRYRGQAGLLIDKFSGQAVLGGFLGLFLALIMHSNTNTVLLAVGLGVLLGIFSKSIFLFALHSFSEANALATRKNVQKAKQINAKLKIAVREKAKSRILMQAQDIIQQMNGPQSQQNLAEFFQNEYDKIAQTTYQKIERHFNYLADRACHGDLAALKRLQQLLPRIKSEDAAPAKSALDVMLDRMFNKRAVAKIKDEVDSAYDRWQYRFLRVA